jgi:hypothetical protein
MVDCHRVALGAGQKDGGMGADWSDAKSLGIG